MKPLRRVQIALSILALATLAGAILRPPPATDPGAMPGRPAPFLPAEQRGRVAIVNFFASWCAYCQAEHPLLQQTSQHGLAIIGIAYKDKPQALKAYLAKNGNPYRVLLQDGDGHIAKTYGVTGVPDSFLIDRHGIIRQHVSGPLTQERLREVLAAAAKL